jgi:5-methylcytosine-specific restriction endonuclease McrA
MPCDYKEYHPKWKLIVRLIKKREDNKCKFCGIENYSLTGNNTKVVLTVAHLNHSHHLHEDYRFSNLAALCQKCHLKHDIKQHISNRRYGRKHKGEHQIKLSL